MMYEDDEKKKKKDKDSKNTVKGNELSVGGVKKKRGVLQALGNTQVYQNHLDRKGDRLFEKKHKGNAESYNINAAERNSELADKGINSSYRYKF